METFKNPNFDISSITNYNGIEALDDIEQYLDFGISQTIRKQHPNITIEKEQYYAKMLLSNFLKGDPRSFTSSFNIRSNINEIGRNKIFYALVKAMIEQHAYSSDVLHNLQPKNEMQEWAEYIAEHTKNGYFENIKPLLQSNCGLLIDNYVNTKYRISSDEREKYNSLGNRNPVTSKALEQLNFEMSLERLGQRR